MRNAALWALVFSLSLLTFAQSNQSAWTKLAALQPGQAIQVVDTAAKKYSGTFVSVSDTALAIQETSSQQSLQKQDVRSVKLMQAKSSNRGRNILIFGAIGAGAGAGIGAAVSSSNCLGCNNKARVAGIGAGVGALIGVVVGAVIPAHGSTTVYNAGGH